MRRWGWIGGAVLVGAVTTGGVDAGQVNACKADRPCFTAVYNDGTTLVIEWTDPGRSNHWNFRWSRDGMDVWNDSDVNVQNFRLKNFRANTNYQFAVQGCYKPPLQRSICSPFEQVEVRSCGAKNRPCR